ncbi:hypothetical protein GCM10022381_35070 [Leifsonia kafniensis]|uniref:Uncharacterized protein n=1 Tax=Leifsonia kafniensis TaxID=475957 RepID=A0ABP7KYH2_9MICO
MARWAVHARVASGLAPKSMGTGIDSPAQIRLDLGQTHCDSRMAKHCPEQKRSDLDRRLIKQRAVEAHER